MFVHKPKRKDTQVILALVLGFLLLVMVGCAAPTEAPEATITSTGVSSDDTPIAAPSETPPPPNTPTESAVEPTFTFTPEPTSTSIPTDTVTPVPSFTPTATPMPDPTEWAKAILEFNDPAGSFFGPKHSFTKTWRIRNIGKTTWTKDFDFVFVSGSPMFEKRIYSLPKKVPPKESIELTIRQTAPNKPGQYVGNWMLRNADGDYFGLGAQADQPLSVRIRVLNVSPDAAYDFILNLCAARWWNSQGIEIPCLGVQSNEQGFVALLENPTLERNRTEDRPAIWVRPYNQIEGKIAGKYPPYIVQEGDHFRAQIGCLAENQGCDVTFKLQYQINDNPIQTLQTWQERHDGNINRVDVDLSSLAGEEVQFILRLLANNRQVDKANGFWLIPRITNVE